MACVLRILCLLSLVHDKVAGKWRGKLVDMSHAYDENTIYFDGIRHFNLSALFLVDTPEVWAQGKWFSTPEHGGTHIDAPSHFFKGKRSVDKIPISQLIGPAVVIDATQKAKKNKDYEVTVADLRQWEAEYGKIPKGAIIMLNFNWAKYWPDPEKILGLVNGIRHYPGLHPDAAKWLVERRPFIHGVGSDCISLDKGPSRVYPTHQILLKKKIFILENLANINSVPNFSTIFAFPMKIAGGTGGPTRVIASIGCNARRGRHGKKENKRPKRPQYVHLRDKD